MPQLTSVNYLNLLRVLQEDDNIRTGEEWEAGDIGQLVGSSSCPCLESAALLEASSQAGFGDRTHPSRAPGMGLRPWSWTGGMTNTGEECVTPPTTPRIAPKGADRDPRQAEESGTAKVPQSGGGEGGGAQVGGPRPSRG